VVADQELVLTRTMLREAGLQGLLSAKILSSQLWTPSFLAATIDKNENAGFGRVPCS
jgi:hypothetical protein